MDASRSFFEVMETDLDFVLASQVLFGLMDRVYREPGYNVFITKHEMVVRAPSKNALWKMIIQKM